MTNTNFLRRTFALFLIATTLFSWSNSGVQLFAQASGTPAPEKAEGVIQLTSKNFDHSLSDGNVWLIEFYAPW